MKFLRQISVLVVVAAASLLLHMPSNGPPVVDASNSTATSSPIAAAVRLPVAHQVTTCQLDSSSRPSYSPQYILSSDKPINNVEFVVRAGTRGCLLVFSCAAVPDTETYHTDQVMTVRASVNSYLNATLYEEDGTMLVPSVSADEVATTVVSMPTTLFVAFQDSGVSSGQNRGRIALSLQCVKAKTWIGAAPDGSPLPNASATNIIDDQAAVTNLLTSSVVYKSWVLPVPNGGKYPTKDRKAYFFSCPIVSAAAAGSPSSLETVPLMVRQYPTLQLTSVKGWTDKPPDELYMVNLDTTSSRVFYKLATFTSDQDPTFSNSGSGFYAVWGSGPDAIASVPGMSLSYTCSSPSTSSGADGTSGSGGGWQLSGIAVPSSNDDSDSWFTLTRIVLISAVILLFLIPAVVAYCCCCRPTEEPKATPTAVVHVPSDSLRSVTPGEGCGLNNNMMVGAGGTMNTDAGLTSSTMTNDTHPLDSISTHTGTGLGSSAGSAKEMSQSVVEPRNNKRESDRLFDAITAPPVKSDIPTKAALGHNPLKAQAALLGLQPVQYFPNTSSTRSPWKGGSGGGPGSVISSETGSTARAPPSVGGTAEYRSEIGENSTVGSERSSHHHRGKGSSPRSPQQPAQALATYVVPLHDLDCDTIVPYRPVSPHLRGSPLPGLSALGGGSPTSVGGGGARGNFFGSRSTSPTAAALREHGAVSINPLVPTDRDASTATITAFQVRRGGSPAARSVSATTSPIARGLSPHRGSGQVSTLRLDNDVVDVSDE